MKQRIETPVSHEEVPAWAAFQVSLSNHPIIRDQDGVLRYKANPLMFWLGEHIDWNDMRIIYEQLGTWSREHYMQWYRDNGYSLDGFADVWSDDLSEMENEQAHG